MTHRAVFLDRDGTLIEHYDYLTDESQVKLMSRVADALRLLRDHGFKLVVVSNQSAVARGMITEKKLAAIHSYLEAKLAEKGAYLDAIYYCPFHPEGVIDKYRRESDMRKPAPGMLKLAAEALHLNLKQCWMVGDDDRDIQAGRAVGCRTILLEHRGSALVQRGRGQEDFKVLNLQEAANLIIHHKNDLIESPRDELQSSSGILPADTQATEIKQLSKQVKQEISQPVSKPQQAEQSQQADKPQQTVIPQQAEIPKVMQAQDSVQSAVIDAPVQKQEQSQSQGPDKDKIYGQEQKIENKQNPRRVYTGNRNNISETVEKSVEYANKVSVQIVTDKISDKKELQRRAAIEQERQKRSQVLHRVTEKKSNITVSPEMLLDNTREGAGKTDETLKNTLTKILQEIKGLRREKEVESEFSVFKVLAGVVQMVVVLCLILAYWFSSGREPDNNAAQQSLLAGVVFQVMTLTFMVISRG